MRFGKDFSYLVTTSIPCQTLFEYSYCRCFLLLTLVNSLIDTLWFLSRTHPFSLPASCIWERHNLWLFSAHSFSSSLAFLLSSLLFLSILVSLLCLSSRSLASTLMSSPVLNPTLVNSNQGWNCFSACLYANDWASAQHSEN